MAPRYLICFPVRWAVAGFHHTGSAAAREPHAYQASGRKRAPGAGSGAGVPQVGNSELPDTGSGRRLAMFLAPFWSRSAHVMQFRAIGFEQIAVQSPDFADNPRA